MNLSDLPEGTRVFVDANIFIHHFEEDAAVGPLCTAFLDRIAREGNGAMSIFNLLEVCGILSFNLNEKQLRELFFYLPEHYRVEVFPDASLANRTPSFKVGDLFDVGLGIGTLLARNATATVIAVPHHDVAVIAATMVVVPGAAHDRRHSIVDDDLADSPVHGEGPSDLRRRW